MTRLALAVLDTSVVIAPPSQLPTLAEVVCVSAVTIGELAYGLRTVNDPVEQAERERRYWETLASFDAIPYTAEVADWFGTLAAVDRRAGRNPRGRTADLMIAATAKSLGAGVITRNPRDFATIQDLVPILAV